MASDISYQPLSQNDFEQLITLANTVHGGGYLNKTSLQAWYKKGIANTPAKINASYVAYHQNKLVGFRVTFTVGSWQLDQWLTPNLWRVDSNKICYFKCNTVDETYRGLGIGSKMLKLSIHAAKKQGALAGVSHLWKQSPNNSAISYFSKCGGELVKLHPDKWHEESKNGYDCILCGLDCHCEAAEMIIYFDH
ncbi:MAG: GNAT family N-acetyltransferase [Gammaproteobacteria bacterium]|nr:MAG: GNAT family N-acetyltransferase [Gammaproteobacteria bacterium]